MASEAADARWMARALALARRGTGHADPNPRVGCVLVREGVPVGEGYHPAAGGPHAEAMALDRAGESARGATAYVTLEPCSHHGRTPPCANALVEAGLSRVVVAMGDPDPRVAGRGLQRLHDAGVEVVTGVLEERARALNAGFAARLTNGRPRITVKLATSLDGQTAVHSGESQWITGEAARADVHRLRHGHAALVTGSGTVLSDDPSLTARLPEGGAHPLRVVLDSRLRTPPGARVVGGPGHCLILTVAGADPAACQALEAAGAEVIELAADAEGRPELGAVWAELGWREIGTALVESGAGLAGAVLRGGWADELVVYHSPSVIGAGGRPMFAGPPIDAMDQARRLTMVRRRAVGEDCKWVVRPA
jgi:diaminohydroxyphosphoribosylaminopyrimidine deaminase/5-amino-6-(5-phosphoribosylamino)uracil reductase